MAYKWMPSSNRNIRARLSRGWKFDRSSLARRSLRPTPHDLRSSVTPWFFYPTRCNVFFFLLNRPNCPLLSFSFLLFSFFPLLTSSILCFLRMFYISIAFFFIIVYLLSSFFTVGISPVIVIQCSLVCIILVYLFMDINKFCNFSPYIVRNSTL